MLSTLQFLQRCCIFRFQREDLLLKVNNCWRSYEPAKYSILNPCCVEKFKNFAVTLGPQIGKTRTGSESEFSFVLTEALCVCGLSQWFNRISLKQKQKMLRAGYKYSRLLFPLKCRENFTSSHESCLLKCLRLHVMFTKARPEDLIIYNHSYWVLCNKFGTHIK